MLGIALKMLLGDRAKYAGLIFGITFTSFLVTFAASYFCGFMTRGFALITENGYADVWVMDPAVASVEPTINIPDSALERVRSVAGVRSAVPLALGTAEARLANGRIQPFELIGVDEATLAGAPSLKGNTAPLALRSPDAAIVDAGGTEGKLETAALAADRWPYDGVHLQAPTRSLEAGDELAVNDHRVQVVGQAHGLPRFPPRPLLYMSLGNMARVLPPERHRITFVLASAAPGIAPRDLALRIAAATGLRARSTSDFKADTVRWTLANSEDVGDIMSMLGLAAVVGFGVTGVMLYMFTYENLRHYAMLSAMGATSRLLLVMILAQAALCALVGLGIGLGLCAIIGHIAAAGGYPFRMMWFTPLAGGGVVVLVSLVAAALSARPVLKLQPMVVFAGR